MFIVVLAVGGVAQKSGNPAEQPVPAGGRILGRWPGVEELLQSVPVLFVDSFSRLNTLLLAVIDVIFLWIMVEILERREESRWIAGQPGE